MSEPAIFRTYRFTRFLHFLLTASVLSAMVAVSLVYRSSGLLETNLLLFLMLAVVSRNVYLHDKETALEEVHVDRNALSVLFRNGSSIIVRRANGATFTEYRDSVSIAFDAFGRPQVLKLDKWRFTPETWDSLLAEIRRVLEDE